jgi:hypothetical protein
MAGQSVVRAAHAALGSIGVHLVVLGAIHAWRARGGGAARQGADPASAPAIDVTVVDITPAPAPAPASEPVAPPPAPAIAPEPRAAPRAATIAPSQRPRGPSAAGPTAAVETGSERSVETAPGPRSRWYRMRAPELRLPDETLARIANARPPPEPAPPPSGRLVQRGREHAAPDRVTPMRVREDGTIAFEDKGDFDVRWALPIPSRKGFGDLIAGWYRDPYAQTRARRVQDMPKHEQAVEGGWDAGAGGDGTIDGGTREPRAPATGGPTVPIIGGLFDLTGLAMRLAKVGDPYAARKRALADATRDERVQIGAAYRARQLDRTGELMQRNLAALARRSLPPAELRRALFALWDECAEGEGAIGEAGQRARALVIGWIRAHLPAGSAGAYAPDEIARLDGDRSSRQRFAPY